MIKLRNYAFICMLAGPLFVHAQNTQIRGFVDVNSSYSKEGSTFSLGEQDLFITSSINDRISFLGETIFKYSATSSTLFAASVERMIINYNVYGNHNLIAGRIHTPINYWNDSYHHGRVFFPTIDRPLLFEKNVIPLHSTGFGIQGKDLGSLKFGYNLFMANGLGSTEILDDDKHKSFTASAYFKPIRNMRIGVSWYNDLIAKGAMVHGMKYSQRVKQNLASLSVANFGKKLEFLAETTVGFDAVDSAGTKTTVASYVYAGYRIKDKFIPYVRYDDIQYHGEGHSMMNNSSKMVVGVRYQINYLAVLKLEYQDIRTKGSADVNKIIAQIAVGF
jgi:hypothetical protein